jgi:hypothetical protein
MTKWKIITVRTTFTLGIAATLTLPPITQEQFEALTDYAGNLL